MLITFVGDEDRSREKIRELIASLLLKKPDASFFRFTTESEQSLEELLFSQGLFSQKYIVLLDNIFEEKIYKEYVVKNLKEIQESPNIVILFETVVDAKTKTKLEKISDKYKDNSVTAKKQEKFNVFSLTDALLQKDKKKLWVGYQKALLQNVSAEEIFGVLMWQVKALVQAQTSANAKEADLKPFVFTKAKKAERVYSQSEAENLLKHMVEMYHDSRRGKGKLELLLERKILAL